MHLKIQIPHAIILNMLIINMLMIFLKGEEDVTGTRARSAGAPCH